MKDSCLKFKKGLIFCCLAFAFDNSWADNGSPQVNFASEGGNGGGALTCRRDAQLVSAKLVDTSLAKINGINVNGEKLEVHINDDEETPVLEQAYGAVSKLEDHDVHTALFLRKAVREIYHKIEDLKDQSANDLVIVGDFRSLRIPRDLICKSGLSTAYENIIVYKDSNSVLRSDMRTIRKFVGVVRSPYGSKYFRTYRILIDSYFASDAIEKDEITWFSNEIYEGLSMTDKAALIVHEAVYRLLRIKRLVFNSYGKDFSKNQLSIVEMSHLLTALLFDQNSNSKRIVDAIKENGHWHLLRSTDDYLNKKFRLTGGKFRMNQGDLYELQKLEKYGIMGPGKRCTNPAINVYKIKGWDEKIEIEGNVLVRAIVNSQYDIFEWLMKDSRCLRGLDWEYPIYDNDNYWRKPIKKLNSLGLAELALERAVTVEAKLASKQILSELREFRK